MQKPIVVKRSSWLVLRDTLSTGPSQSSGVKNFSVCLSRTHLYLSRNNTCMWRENNAGSFSVNDSSLSLSLTEEQGMRDGFVLLWRWELMTPLFCLSHSHSSPSCSSVSLLNTTWFCMLSVPVSPRTEREVKVKVDRIWDSPHCKNFRAGINVSDKSWGPRITPCLQYSWGHMII